MSPEIVESVRQGMKPRDGTPVRQRLQDIDEGDPNDGSPVESGDSDSPEATQAAIRDIL